jgi:hypothetical protein
MNKEGEFNPSHDRKQHVSNELPTLSSHFKEISGIDDVTLNKYIKDPDKHHELVRIFFNGKQSREVLTKYSTKEKTNLYDDLMENLVSHADNDVLDTVADSLTSLPFEDHDVINPIEKLSLDKLQPFAISLKKAISTNRYTLNLDEPNNPRAIQLSNMVGTILNNTTKDSGITDKLLAVELTGHLRSQNNKTHNKNINDLFDEIMSKDGGNFANVTNQLSQAGNN